jgi:hypothetical protein
VGSSINNENRVFQKMARDPAIGINLFSIAQSAATSRIDVFSTLMFTVKFYYVHIMIENGMTKIYTKRLELYRRLMLLLKTKCNCIYE